MNMEQRIGAIREAGTDLTRLAAVMENEAERQAVMAAVQKIANALNGESRS